MNSSVPRVGLVGLGGYGEQHLRLLNTLHDAGLCRLVGAADPFLERHASPVRALRSRGAIVHERWEELLARDEVEAVFLATPIHWHARQTIAALQAGKSVYLEKPPCATLGEWEQMMAAQRQSGQVCAVGFQMQSSGALRFLKSQLAAGAIGPLRHAWGAVRWRRDDAYYARSDWAGRWQVDGQPVFDGPATNALAHAVFALLSLAADDESPSHESPFLSRVRGALKRARPIESYDSAFLEAQTAQGVHLRLALTHATECSDPVVLRLSGEAGSAELGWDGHVTLRPHQSAAQEWHFADNPALGATLDFLRALRQTGPALRTSLQDTLPYLQLVNGALQSASGAQDFPAALVEHVQQGEPRGYYRVRGLDQEMAVFAGDFHRPPPLLSARSHPWLEAQQWQPGLCLE